MKLQDQVCTLAQAKRLKELGVEQNSLFVHLVGKGGAHEHIGLRTYYMEDHRSRYPAYTVAELGEMLPSGFNTMKVTADYPGNTFWRGYDDSDNDFPADTLYHNEAQARAAMLIHLIENNLITIEQNQ